MGSEIVKRSVVINGHKTSVSLEQRFWEGVKFVAGEKNFTISGLLAEIDGQRTQDNLSSAIRLYVFDYYVSLIPQQEHDSEPVDPLPSQSPPSAGKPSRSS
jgi:predicted DNA-binding ribbon-helix-helix protein